jgi:hypothetical protein
MAVTPRQLVNTLFVGRIAKLCWGIGLLLLCGIGILGWLHEKTEENDKKKAPPPKLGLVNPVADAPKETGILKAGTNSFVAFVPASPTPPPVAAPAKAAAERTPPLTVRQFLAGDQPTREAPQSPIVTVPPLVTDYIGNSREDEVEVEPLPTVFLHRGEFLPCKLVITLDSSSLRTPVVAILTRDVYNKRHELILPAGSEIHALCGRRSRDRIEVDGAFRAVFEDGREVEFAGIALDRKDALKTNGQKTWDITDGSAGILGTIIEPKNGEIQLLIAALVQGFSQGTQDCQTNAFGTTTVVGSLRNGGLQAASNIADYEAQRILEKLKESGSFVRVPAGTDFYIYTTSILAPEEASYGGIKQREMALRRAAAERQTVGNASLDTQTTPEEKRAAAALWRARSESVQELKNP